MSPAEAIRKRGFHRWYERQLIESHAYLVTCFLCLIVVAACMENVSVRGPGEQLLMNAVAILVGAIVGFVSLKRYWVLLFRAEHIAEHSNCAQCSAYGRLQILESGGGAESSIPDSPLWLRVQCRKCGHQWLIE